MLKNLCRYSISLLILCAVYITVHGSIQTIRLYRNTDFNDKTCVDTERIFQLSARSKVFCVKMCNGGSGCISVFYEAATMTCTTCRGYFNVGEHSGTIFLAKMISCGTLPSPDNVEINYSGNAVYGDQATYTCIPFNYSPAGGVGVITCQADGTWSTALCAPAAVAGFLPNGQPIPRGSVGCVSTHGTTCLGTRLTAHVRNGLNIDGVISDCWCGNSCRTTSCCFDVNC